MNTVLIYIYLCYTHFCLYPLSISGFCIAYSTTYKYLICDTVRMYSLIFFRWCWYILLYIIKNYILLITAFIVHM